MAVETKADTPVMQCPYLVGTELCRKVAGHRGRHRPGPFVGDRIPVISDRRARRIGDRLRAAMDRGGRRRWGRPPRCPRCRAVIDTFSLGAGLGPVVVFGSGRAERECQMTVGPCGHRFRWISEVKRSGDR